MNAGELIKQRRKELNLTLEQIGEAVGVSKSTVKKWQDGNIKNMRLHRVAALANVLKVSPTKLVFTDDTTTDYITDRPAVTTEQQKYIDKYKVLDEISLATVNNCIDFEYTQTQRRKTAD